MDQAFLHKLTETIEANLHDEKFGVTELSRAMGMSRSGIHRKVKTLTKKPLNQLIREYRLHKAMEMLRNQEATASEIAYRVGFGSPAYFTKCFHDSFGYSPGEVKKTDIQDQNPPDNPFIRSLLSGKSDPEHMKYSWNILKKLNIRVVFFIILSAVILFGIIIISNIPLLKRSDHARSHRETNPDKSIAVLPFKNLSDDSDNQYFADGIMEDILNRLFSISDLKVISRTTAEHFRESNMTSPEIAEQLHVGYVLEGSVLKYKNKVRIFVQLIDARRDQHILSKKYDRDLTDIFAIQSDIAKNIARELAAALSEKEAEQIEKVYTKNPEAYDLYLMGRFFWNKRTEDGFKKSIEYFEKSVAADPDYALAYAGLADAYFLFTWYGLYPKVEGYTKAKEFASRAIEIDIDLAEPHATLGSLIGWSEYKWEEARNELLLAIELSPNYAMARSYYSELLNTVGQNDEAREQINIAIELDPFFRVFRSLSGMYYYHEGKLEKSLDEFRKSQELFPYIRDFWACFDIYIMQGEDIKALETLQQIMLMDTSTIIYAKEVKDIYNKSGLNGLLNWLIEWHLRLDPENPEPYLIAKWYAMQGKKEDALKWLEKGVEEHSSRISRIINEPTFENLRTEPRFFALINKMGLSDYFSKSASKNLPE
jgi:TolB-like protein/AraC-like DNA-binding protein